MPLESTLGLSISKAKVELTHTPTHTLTHSHLPLLLSTSTPLYSCSVVMLNSFTASVHSEVTRWQALC